MNLLQVILRAVHVLGGVIWVGTMFFNTIFLLPAIRDAGPDGGKVMNALVKRGLPVFMPVVALLTIISGSWLYWRASVGFQPEYMRSGPGMAFGTGGVLAILAFLVGMVTMRPMMMKMAALGPRVAQAAAGERDALVAEMNALRDRLGSLGNVVLVLLVCAALAMGIAQYM
ncbi:MAG TPA: hypothetical protein VJR92_08735 [Gemmatimonadaceae bacterium]|nr:hypothetical protein [Gemmatimonadaceae bacterium]